MKRLYMLAITSLLVAACAEDIDNNNLGKPLISFGVNEPYAAVADSNEPAATRSFNATDAFTPGNSLFSNAVYASDADKQSAANRVQVESLEGDYPQELCMLVSKEPWPQPSTATRATENTTAVLNASGKQIGIYSSIYSGNADYSTSSSKFEPTTATAWPTTGSSSTAYDIYAWHPTTFTSTGISMSGQTFTYTLPTTSAAMVDLIGTKESHSYSENNDGSISLTFNHLLAPVCFKLAAGLSGTITSIKFSNIVTTGTYTLGATHADDATYGYTWTATTTGAYTASVSGTGGASEVQVDGSHYFMMIPQTVAAGVVVTITITDGASQSNTLTYTVPSGGQVWKAGQVTTYTISTSTITSFTLTYPQWTESGGSGTTYGPVDNYDVTTEDYGYVGLFAVDKANKIVISNAKVKITSAASHVGTCDLTDAANTAVLGNYILSQNYAYYVYYPYKSSLTGIPANDQTTYSTLAQSAAAQATPADAADTFFANVTAGWTVATDQSSEDLFKSQDLQIAKLTGSTALFTMVHKMGLLHIEMPQQSAYKTKYMQISGSNWVENTTKKTNSGNTTSRDATINFSNSTWKPWAPSHTNCYLIGIPSSNVLPITAKRASTEDYEDYYNWSVTDQKISSTNGYTHYELSITNNVYLKQAWEFNYEGAGRSFAIPATGIYCFECWGAQGGSLDRVYDYGPDSNGGKGGYSMGIFAFTTTPTIYVYVGQGGIANSISSTRPFGGGGGGNNCSNLGTKGSQGGGSTDFRFVSATETDGWGGNSSLPTRFVIAGGGGGTSDWFTATNSEDIKGKGLGGAGGGINGGNAKIGYRTSRWNASEVSNNVTSSGGATQTVGGTVATWNGVIFDEHPPVSGNYGYGASTTQFHSGAGGGGHYGGATGGTISGLVSTGSGGSGFVSGASGCVAISGYRNPSDVTQVQYNSVSYKCTTSSLINGENSLPKSSGLYKASYESSDMETGHTGNGFARITRFQILDY